MLTCGGASVAGATGTSYCVWVDGALQPPTFSPIDPAICFGNTACDRPVNDPVCGDTGAEDGCGSFPKDCQPDPGDKDDGGGGNGRPDTDSCGIPDTEGADPIHLPTKAAVTEPYVDFELQGLARIKLERTYTSADVTVPKGSIRTGKAPGNFGRGWHHNWESYVTCRAGVDPSPDTCWVVRGLKSQKIFTKSGEVVLANGERWAYFQRKGLEALADGDQDLLVRRTVGGVIQGFMLYGVDGTEHDFAQHPVDDASNCAYDDPSYCPAAWGAGGVDVMSKGKAALTRVVDLAGNATAVSRDHNGGVRLRLTDAGTGGVLELRSSGQAGSQVDSLWVNGSRYVTYEYAAGTTGRDLTVVRADPEGTRLRTYTYNRTGAAPGHLWEVRGESAAGVPGPVLVEFGYDPSLRASSVTDESSSVEVTYPGALTTVASRSAGASTSTRTRSRGASGVTADFGAGILEVTRELQRKTSCFTDADGRTVLLGRDDQRRVTRVRRFLGSVFKCSAWSADPGKLEATLAGKPTIADLTYGYGLERIVAPGLPPVKLDIVTAESRASLVTAGTSTSRTLDFSPAALSDDPAGYACTPAGVTLPAGAAPCRITEAGVTRDLLGNPVTEERRTWHAYDSYGRVVQTIGPVSRTRPFADDVTPIEQRTYWEPGESQVARRGRLKTISRMSNGLVADANAFVATLDWVQSGLSSVAIRRKLEGGVATDSTWTQVLDSRGRPVAMIGPAGATAIEYFDGKKPSLVVSPTGGSTRFTYAVYGRLQTIESLDGDPRPPGSAPALLWREERQYDGAGSPRVIERYGATGALTFRQEGTFDSDHRPISALHPSVPGAQASWEYTAGGSLRAWVDEKGFRTEFDPDDLGRPRGVKRVVRDAQGNPTQQLQLASYAWEDALGEVKSVTDGAGQQTSYQRDDFGRIVTVTSAGAIATPVRQVFDVRDNVKQRKVGATSVSYAYDGEDRLMRLAAVSTAGAAPVHLGFTYDYDGTTGSMIGKLRTASAGTAANALRRTSTFSWDDAGRLTGEAVAVKDVTAKVSTGYVPDAAGALTLVTYPSGTKARYARDLTGRVQSVRSEQANNASRLLASNVAFEPRGQLKSLSFGNGMTMLRTSNLRYEPTALASGPLALGYTMGASGNVEGMTTNASDARVFGYDLANRLVTMSPESLEPSYAFTYVGQAVTQAKALATGPEVPVYAFGYDQQRSVTAVGKYDAAGVQIPTTVCLVHDALGRLTAVGPALARLSGPGVTACEKEGDLASVSVRFEYDAFSRRAGRQDGSAWKEYVHDPQGRLLAELARPATAGGAWSTVREYVWLEGQPLAQQDYPGPAGRTDGYTYYFHLDHLGQPRALTGESGAKVWSAAPGRPYGNVVESTAIDPLNWRTVVTNLRLPGQYDERLLASVGLQGPYYNWNRWYLPAMGRYLELDPIALHGGFNGPFGPNWYGYAEGNPLRWTDEEGLKGGDHPSEGACLALGHNPVACQQVPPKDVPPRTYDLNCWADCYKSTRTMCKAPKWLSSGLLARLGVQILAPEVGYPLWVLCEVIDGEACESKCAIKPPEPPRPPKPQACGK